MSDGERRSIDMTFDEWWSGYWKDSESVTPILQAAFREVAYRGWKARESILPPPVEWRGEDIDEAAEYLCRCG